MGKSYNLGTNLQIYGTRARRERGREGEREKEKERTAHEMARKDRISMDAVASRSASHVSLCGSCLVTSILRGDSILL